MRSPLTYLEYAADLPLSKEKGWIEEPDFNENVTTRIQIYLFLPRWTFFFY